MLSEEATRLLGSTEKDVDRDKNGEDVPKLESAEVVLVHCNLVNNNYQQACNVLFTFVPNKQLGQLQLMQNFHLLKYGLHTKIMHHLK